MDTLFEIQPLNVKGLVKNLLLTNPETRDNDSYLLTEIWRSQIKKRYGSTNVNVGSFLNDLASYQFVHFETIRRYRQMLQESDITLRGKSYKKRKVSSDKVAKEIINSNL